MSVVTRFPPSPTGYLHLGGARTALFNWLYARKHQGKMILRIEDTDRERSTEESVQAIFDGMEWLGLDHDEGPYFQTLRFERYKEVIQQLLDQSEAYPCFCTRERLDALREEQKERGDKPRYDGRCRDLETYDMDAEAVIRFKNPQSGTVAWDDLVKGKIEISNDELDDLIIARSDGSPTYNLTVVVDDMDMGMTHVIRGDDHVNNTPRQLNILDALEADRPKYAHVPMILGGDGSRMSKRHGAVSVMAYREEGFLPQAMLNYLARLGWSHGDEEIFSIDELIAKFDLEHVHKSPARFDIDKLKWMNQHYIKESKPQELVAEYQWHQQRLGIAFDKGPAAAAVIEAHQERAKTLLELATTTRFYFAAPESYQEKDAKKHFKPQTAEILADLLARSQALESWNGAAMHDVVQAVAEAFDVGMGKVGQPLRVAVSGAGNTPSLDITLDLLGREQTEARLAAAVAWIGENVS
ncbi:MAG: glutamate--tRNA ligase [Oceanococcus sp.]